MNYNEATKLFPRLQIAENLSSLRKSIWITNYILQEYSSFETLKNKLSAKLWAANRVSIER